MWQLSLREEIEEMFRILGGVFMAHDGFQLTREPLTAVQKERRNLEMKVKRNQQAHACPVCGKHVALRNEGTGRQKIYCGNKCKWQAWKGRQTNDP